MDPIKASKIFVDGAMFQRPREGAPEFIKGHLSINPVKLIAWMRANHKHMSQKGWLNIDLKASSKDGTLYMELNTWKPASQQVPPQNPSALPPQQAAQVRHARDNYNDSRTRSNAAASDWSDTGFDGHYAPEINGSNDEINPEDIPF